ncbi:MAG: GMC family oxidoreductase N-terminal domain-containing protein [Gemmatimonadota bacterium]
MTSKVALASADPVAAGLARGWKVVDAPVLNGSTRVECDVVVIGTGAGGGVSAELLSKAGLDVVLVEEGPLKSSRDFKNMLEAEAYPSLYFDSAARKTRDKAINILQGRAVGGSTTVNWTSSFRTPPATLAYWRERFGLRDYTVQELAPYFEQAEARLGVALWEVPPNENNAILQRGGARLGIPMHGIPRNVRGCWDLGYCGVGCPVNAKQSMLVTTIPAALDRGARLYTRLRAQRFEFDGNRIARLVCAALGADGLTESGATVEIRARHYVAAGGAINTPGLLLRSSAPDPYQLLGRRTFLHPTVISAAMFEQSVEAYAGAPQSIYSDHFLQTDAIDGPLGFKLESAPLHPVIYASTLHGFGPAHAQLMSGFAHAQVILALLRDGFHPESRGGRVELRRDGGPVLDYPLNDPIWEAARRALTVMAEIQFAAGAVTVYPVHELAAGYRTFGDATQAIAQLPMKPLLMRVVSAHVMGGCPMAASERNGVTDARGRHFQIENLSVHDASLFPTSIGANPQLSIFAIVNRITQQLVAELTGSRAPALD